jgi:DNA-binding CsgD family transcriptional regulator
MGSCKARGARSRDRAAAALTARETEVLGLVRYGKTNRDVAAVLGLSSRTVQKHLEHIYEKLGVETRTAAVLAWQDPGALAT